jgi:signal transduction histidine kinase/CheY-like chemotaxis protein
MLSLKQLSVRLIVYVALSLTASMRAEAEIFHLQKAGVPLQKVYNTQEIGLEEIWTGVVLPDGRLLFAGQGDGVALFDGWKWQLLEVETPGTVRAMLVDGDRVWIGGTEGVGYVLFTNDTAKYVPIPIAGLNENESLPTIRYILRSHQNIYFFSDLSAYFFRSEQLLEIGGPDGSNCYPFFIEDHLFAQKNSRIYSYNELVEKVYYEHSDIQQYIIKTAWAYDNKTFVITNQGIHTLKQNEIQTDYRFSQDFNSDLVLTRATQLPDQTIAVATLGTGLLHIKRDGTILEQILPRNHIGIKNIENLFLVDESTLCLLSRSAVFFVDISPAVRSAHFTRGFPYNQFWDAAFFRDEFYFANSEGLFKASEETVTSLIFDPVFENEIYGIVPTGKRLLLATPWDLIELNPDGSHSTVVDNVTTISALPIADDKIWVTTHIDVRLMEHMEGRWQTKNAIGGFRGEPTQLASDERNGVWIATNSGEIKYFNPNESPRLQDPELAISSLSGKSAGVFSRAGKPYIITKQHLFRNAGGHTFDPVHLEGPTPTHAVQWEWIIPLHFPQHGDLWLLKKNLIYGGYRLGELVIEANGSIRWDGQPINNLDHLGSIQSIVSLSQGTDKHELAVVGSDGIEFIKLPASVSPRLLKAPHLEVRTTSSGKVEKQALNFQEGSGANPTFTYYTPYFGLQSDRYFQTRLQGLDDKWSPLTRQTEIAYPGLKRGNYRFEVRVIDDQGHVSESSGIELSVEPPWYQSLPAAAIYSLALIAFGALLVQARLREAKKREAILETKVRERTAELEKANRVKSDFVASMSHEIRNPMNGIIGGVKLLKPNTPVTREQINSLSQRADYLNRLVNNILDFSKIESGKMTLKPEVFKPGDLADTIRLLFADIAMSAGIELRVAFEGDRTTKVFSDRSRIEQIVVNLVSNAIRFTDEGYVSVELRLIPAKNNQILFAIAVEDSGVGVAPEDQKKIFEPFQQSVRSAPKKRGEKGTGLGLTIVTDIVNMLGGSLRFQSELGEGTRFDISLPLEISLEATDNAFQDSQIKLEGHYLIAEDLDYNLEIYKHYFEDWGARVSTALDGKRAMALLAEQAFDAIFLDWDLPDCSGLEIAERIRANEFPLNTSTPIIAQTAFVGKQAEKACRDAGMNGFIEKPANPEKILTELRVLVPERLTSINSARGETAILKEEIPDSSLYRGNLEMLAVGSGKTLQVQIAEYIETYNAFLMKLREAAKTGDLKCIRSEAHKIKGHLGLVNDHESIAFFKGIVLAVDKEETALLENLLSNELGSVVKASLQKLEALSR